MTAFLLRVLGAKDDTEIADPGWDEYRAAVEKSNQVACAVLRLQEKLVQVKFAELPIEAKRKLKAGGASTDVSR